MTDIFVSYKREDRARARPIVDALRIRGYDVWWDAGMLPAGSFARDISEVIETAKVVLTLWTEESVTSDWVVAESEHGRRRDKYIGALLDPEAKLPLPFSALQYATMTGTGLPWEELDWLCQGIDAIIGLPISDQRPERDRKATTASETEAAVWYKVRHDDTVQSYEFYLTQYTLRGVFASQARERLRVLATRWYRFKQWMDTGIAKAVMVTTILASVASVYGVTQKSTASPVSLVVHATLEEEVARLKDELFDAGERTSALMAALQHTKSLGAYAALQTELTDMRDVEAQNVGRIEQVECELKVVTRQRDRLRAIVEGGVPENMIAAGRTSFDTCPD